MKKLISVLSLLLLSACGFSQMPDNLTQAILNQNDPATVRDGAPAYLLLLDTLIQGDPSDVKLLRAGATLYGVYGDIFVADPQRSARLSERSWSYGRRSLCSEKNELCHMEELPFDQFNKALRKVEKDDLETFFAYTVSWLAWMKHHAGDWNALADLPKVEAALNRILELEEYYDQGRAHQFMGILLTLRPPAFGGKPEEGRRHFLRAIELSQGKDLGAKVAYARHYARLLYDRPLHDQLLQEVLAAPVQVRGLTLMNILAQEDARKLLSSGEEYF